MAPRKTGQDGLWDAPTAGALVDRDGGEGGALITHPPSLSES
ncbi:hypothetical protein ACWGN5_35350 [Streptomyces sp. NPDC055815]